MSVASDVQQYLLDLLFDGIYTSSVANQQIGYTNPTKLRDEQLPFVQVYLPIIVHDEVEFRRSNGTLSLVMELIESASATTDLQQVADNLAETLRADTTMRNLVTSCEVASSGVVQRFTDETRFLQVAITCTLNPDDRTKYTDILDLVDDGTWDVNSEGGGLMVQSELISGALSFRKTSGSRAGFFSIASINPAFPLDLSVTNYLRCQVYHQSTASGDLQNAGESWFEVRIGLDANDYRGYFAVRGCQRGWTEYVFDLSKPFVTIGVPNDLSNTDYVSIVWFGFGPVWGSHAAHLARLGYEPRDTGSKRGVNPGF